MRLRFLQLLPITWLACLPAARAVDNAMLWTEEVQTRYGTLQVINYKYPYLETHLDQLKLNGHVRLEVRNVLSITKAPVFRMQDADIVLLDVAQGGSGCPSAWRILSIRAPDQVAMTQEIAMCSNPAIAVKQIGDSLELSPELCVRDYDKPFWTGVCWQEIWRYRDGRLVKLRETPKRMITPGPPATETPSATPRRL